MTNIPEPYPILLAAGPSPRLGSPKSPVVFHGRNAIEIAVENCNGLPAPIIVLGYQAAFFARQVPRGPKIVVNTNWRAGQLRSLLAGMRAVPRYAAFLLYLVDHVFLIPRVIQRLVRVFKAREQGKEIFMPRFHGRSGHPVIFSGVIRPELEAAETARAVVYRDERRICYVPVRTPTIWKDFDPSAPPASGGESETLKLRL